jgi:hypothetical protein
LLKWKRREAASRGVQSSHFAPTLQVGDNIKSSNIVDRSPEQRLGSSELRRCFLKKKKALDYDSRGLWLNGESVESGERR